MKKSGSLTAAALGFISNRIGPEDLVGINDDDEPSGPPPPSKANCGCLAVRVPDSATYAPPAICNISKDGRIAAVGGRDQDLSLWNLETGELATTIQGHDLFWTASSDSSFFLTAQEDNRLVVWEMATFQPRVTLGPVPDTITHCSISSDKTWIVAGNSKGKVFAWDAETGQIEKVFEDGHRGSVAIVSCFQQQGVNVLVSCGSDDRTICCWDIEGERKLGAFEISELENAKKMKYWITRDGAAVVAWCTDSVPFPNLVVVDTVNDVKNCVYCHDGLVTEARFNNDGTRIVSCGSDGCVNIWDTATLECLRTLSGHEGNVLCVALNDTGSRIVSSGEDCTVRIWNAEDGQQLLSFQAQDEPVKHCMFSMNSRRVLTCDMAGRVYIWSMHVDFLVTLLRKFADTVSAVAMSGNQQLCVVGCNTGRIMMWDVWQRATVWEYSHHTARVESCAFNSDLSQIVTAGADGHVHIVNVATGKQDTSFLEVGAPVFAATFSPDDELVAALSTGGSLLVYQADGSIRKPKHILTNSVARVTSYAWTPNGRMIAGACLDGCVLIWNALNSNIYTVLNGPSTTTCCAFDAAGKYIAVGTVMGTTLLYNVETSEQLCELEQNAAPVKDVIFKAGGEHVTTVCNRQAIVWDVSTVVNRKPGADAAPTKTRVYDFVIDKERFFKTTMHSYRSTIAHYSTCLFDHEAEAIVMDMLTVDDPLLRSTLLAETRMVQSGTETNRFLCWSALGSASPDKFHTTHDAVNCVSFSSDDRLLVMGSQDGSVIIYDVVHNEIVEVLPAHVNGPCRCVVFSGDAKEVLSCGADAKVILWDWRSRSATKIYSGHFISIGCCDMSGMGERVVSGDNHGMLCIWEKVTGNQVQTLPLAHAKAVLAVSITADGLTVASVGMDGKASVWNVDTGAELVSLAAALESQALFCRFSPDGYKLAISEENGNVMVWNVAANCQWFQIYNAHKGKVTGCAWSGDCRRLVTCGVDSIMCTWDGESGAPLSKYNVKAGQLTGVTMSPEGVYVAAGSVTGTLSVVNIAHFAREIPEPSFLYNWLSAHDQNPQTTYLKLAAAYFALANVQDAQGWSIVTHTASRGNAEVMSMVLDTLPENYESLGLLAAVPYHLRTRVEMTGVDGGAAPSTEGSVRPTTAFGGGGRPTTAFGGGARPTTAFNRHGSMSVGRTSMSLARLPSVSRQGAGDPIGPQKSMKSINQQLKKVALRLFQERVDTTDADLIRTNAIALALNSKSSQVVQLLLDATASKKVSFGSYHAFTDIMPSLAVRYPIMCCVFLTALDLRSLGDLEVPVAVLKGVSKTVIRTAPFFTNVNNLWQGHLQLHEVRKGPQPYAHVKAVMVRLPYACSVGRQSLLRTLLQSDVPVQVYCTPSMKAVIRHKWKLYASGRIWIRAVVFMFYVCVFTVFAILFQQVATEDGMKIQQFWSQGGPKAKVMVVFGGYILSQTCWYLWLEMQQLWNSGISFYFRSPWNVFDLTQNTLMVVVMSLFYARVSVGDGYVLPTLVAIEVLLVWFKVFFFSLAFEHTGKVTLMLFALMKGIIGWVVLLLMSIIVFAVSLMVLYEYQWPGGLHPDAQYSSYGDALLTMWKAVFFQFDLDGAMYLPRGWLQLFIIVFSVFMYLVHIVLFPMLIALSRDIYQAVKQYEEAVFLKTRAMLIMETETLMSKAQVEKYSVMPPYVHLLTPVSRDLKSMTPDGFDRLENTLKTQMDAMTQKLAGIGGGTSIYNNASNLFGAPGKDGKDGRGGGGGEYDPANAEVNVALNLAEQMQAMSMAAANALSENESVLPAVLRQIDRLQRTVNNQELRLEGVVTVLRDIENLLRNQAPVVIHQESQIRTRHNVLSEAELEAEVKRLLGNASRMEL